jgi:putative ABC transport system substrate-binding protein
LNKRRLLIAASGAFVLRAPLAALAQPTEKIWRIGFFYVGTRQSALDTGRYGAFIDGMRQLGYVEGKNLIVVERFASDGDYARMPEVATELVRANVDVIVATGSPATQALRHATSSLPVIVTLSANPVTEGIAASLARPGSNFTGLSAVLDEVFPKQIDFLKTAVPKLARVAVLSKSGNPAHSRFHKLVEDVSRERGIQVLRVDINGVEDMERGFLAMSKQRAQALIILGDSFFVQHFKFIAALAIKHKLASTYSGREYPAAGGFMSYGPSFADNFRRAATYVDKILKGAKPGNLPIEQPTRIYLTINRKTAAALGLKIPQEFLLRADEVIN